VDTPDPIELLERALTTLQASKPLAPDCRRWLTIGLAAWLEGSPLEEALELNRTERNRRLRARRNHHLRQAWQAVTHEPIGPWERSGRLLAALDRFRSILWPSWRDRPDLPEHASVLHTCLYQVCKAGRPPETRRRVHAICFEIRDDGFSE
jgi:hypothetical protein